MEEAASSQVTSLPEYVAMRPITAVMVLACAVMAFAAILARADDAGHQGVVLEVIRILRGHLLVAERPRRGGRATPHGPMPSVI